MFGLCNSKKLKEVEEESRDRQYRIAKLVGKIEAKDSLLKDFQKEVAEYQTIEKDYRKLKTMVRKQTEADLVFNAVKTIMEATGANNKETLAALVAGRVSLQTRSVSLQSMHPGYTSPLGGLGGYGMAAGRGIFG